jgi:hypothetical protein
MMEGFSRSGFWGASAQSAESEAAKNVAVTAVIDFRVEGLLCGGEVTVFLMPGV